MEIIQGKSFDEERALYGKQHLHLIDCAFTGEADGESAVKECSDVIAENCLCNLRYPFWHVHGLVIRKSDITENGRAALWYSDHIEITDTKMHGIKALRECHDVSVRNCDIISNEFGWFASDFAMEGCKLAGDYTMLHSHNVSARNVTFRGRYILQYMHDCVFEACDITSRDAFWHAQNVTVKNSVLRGEFLGWYSNHLTLDHCRILSSQPLCYCKNLKLVDCEVVDSDLCFENSEIDATIVTSVDSIKNPLSGTIRLPDLDELIRTDPRSKAKIVFDGVNA